MKESSENVAPRVDERAHDAEDRRDQDDDDDVGDHDEGRA